MNNHRTTYKAITKKDKFSEFLRNHATQSREQNRLFYSMKSSPISESFIKRYDNYLEKKLKDKEQSQNMKPVFKFVHVDNSIKFNFKDFELKSNSKKIFRERYKHIKAKVDTGLHTFRPAQPPEKENSNVKTSLVPETIIRPIVRNPHRELSKILHDSIHKNNYNLRNTPARLSSNLNITNRKIRKSLKVKANETHEKIFKFKAMPTNMGDKEHAVPIKYVNKEIESKILDLTTYPYDGPCYLQIEWFEKLYTTHLNYMIAMNNEWRSYIMDNPHLKEEINDEIRTAIGQMNLFKNGRYKQFGHLVESAKSHELKNLFPIKIEKAASSPSSNKLQECPPNVTYPSDLLGFWEMINPQIVNINERMNNLTLRKESNWTISRISEIGNKAPKTSKTLTPKSSNHHKKQMLSKKTSKNSGVKANKASLRKLSTSSTNKTLDKSYSNIEFVKVNDSLAKVNKKPFNFTEWRKLNAVKSNNNNNGGNLIFKTDFIQLPLDVEKNGVTQHTGSPITNLSSKSSYREYNGTYPTAEFFDTPQSQRINYHQTPELEILREKSIALTPQSIEHLSRGILKGLNLNSSKGSLTTPTFRLDSTWTDEVGTAVNPDNKILTRSAAKKMREREVSQMMDLETSNSCPDCSFDPVTAAASNKENRKLNYDQSNSSTSIIHLFPSDSFAAPSTRSNTFHDSPRFTKSATTKRKIDPRLSSKFSSILEEEANMMEGMPHSSDANVEIKLIRNSINDCGRRRRSTRISAIRNFSTLAPILENT